MSVRKRIWKGKDGESREAWVVDYADQLGSRHHKTFRRKKDADRYHATVTIDVASGVHTPTSGMGAKAFIDRLLTTAPRERIN
jgi:integrase